MQFAINWNNGYVICVLMKNERGFMQWFPLRNFGEHQGDAKLFKYADCPELTDNQIRMLIKNYNPDVIYKRINSRRFIIEKRSYNPKNN